MQSNLLEDQDKMTIVTKPLSGVKEKKNDVVVSVISVEKKCAEEKKKSTTASNLILMICILSILILTVFAGAYIYKGMKNHK